MVLTNRSQVSAWLMVHFSVVSLLSTHLLWRRLWRRLSPPSSALATLCCPWIAGRRSCQRSCNGRMCSNASKMVVAFLARPFICRASSRILWSRWFKRLSDSKQCLKIVAALRPGCKEPPLSYEELKPYIDDLCDILGCPPGDRLHLWYHLASFLGDPDAQLVKGVPLGVNQNTHSFTSPASPCWHGGLSRTLARMQ